MPTSRMVTDWHNIYIVAMLRFEMGEEIRRKVDVYNLEQRHKNWIEYARGNGIDGLTKANSDHILAYITDMEEGRNVARGSRKGGRGYARLTSIRTRMTQIAKLLQERSVKDITKVSDNQITKLFSDMHKGEITTLRGEMYKSTGDYAEVFKAFWHWWMRVNRRKGRRVLDLTEDVSTASATPKFAYLTKEDVEALLPYFPEDEQVLLMFLFDSIVRPPSEVLGLQVRDVFEKDGDVWIGVPDEISKTFGRTFNLLYCGEALLELVRRRGLKPEDPLFQFSPAFLNRKLKRVAAQVFGDRIPHPKSDYYKNLSLYDFRHSGAIHLRLLAKDNPADISLDAIRHRGGWADFNMLNYYTQFIGLDGKIERQGMLLKQDRHKIEKDLEEEKKKRLALERKIRELAKRFEAALPALRRRQPTTNTAPHRHDERHRYVAVPESSPRSPIS